MKLPPGYEIFFDEEGDWDLIPPPDVVLFDGADPGDWHILNAKTRASALKEAIAYLKTRFPELFSQT